MDQRWSVSSHRSNSLSLRFKAPIVVLTLSHISHITHLISSPSGDQDSWSVLGCLFVGEEVKVKLNQNEKEKMLPRRCHTFVRFCHKQSRCLVLSGAASANRLDETFQVFYQKIFTSVKYCLAMLSADTGKIGPHRTFQSKRDHFHQNPNQSQTGCDI